MCPLLCFISCLHCIGNQVGELSNEMTIALHCCNRMTGGMQESFCYKKNSTGMQRESVTVLKI